MPRDKSRSPGAGQDGVAGKRWDVLQIAAAAVVAEDSLGTGGRPMARIQGWLRHRQVGFTALALYTVLAVAMMGPMAPVALHHTGAQDLCNHVSGIIEAKNA